LEKSHALIYYYSGNRFARLFRSQMNYSNQGQYPGAINIGFYIKLYLKQGKENNEKYYFSNNNDSPDH